MTARPLSLEVRNSETPIEGLHTVCQEAACPNILECWEDREATFLIGGEQCTRRRDFCQIDTGGPADLDRDEPGRVAESVASRRGLSRATRPARCRLRADHHHPLPVPLNAPPSGGALDHTLGVLQTQGEAEQTEFASAVSGPLVRSSSHAARLYRQALEKKNQLQPESRIT